MKAVLITSFVVTLLFLSGCTAPASLSPEEYTSIQEGFTVPHDTNVVWCYYYWIGDDISRHGVTKDMEAMKEFGIGGILIGNINPDEKDGRVPLFSEEWWDITVHAVNEGQRLGIDVGFFNCPGWSQSGGPWVTYDKAMRHLVYSEMQAEGPGKINLTLPKPADEFQDTYVLAFKSIEKESVKADHSNSTVISSPAVVNPLSWLDGDHKTAALFEVSNTATYTITIKPENEITARSILLYPAQPGFKCDVDLQAKVDGTFKSIKTFTFDRRNPRVNVGPVTHGPVSVSLPETTSGEFQLICTRLSGTAPKAGFSEIVITEAQVLENYVEKSLGKMHPTPLPSFDSYMWPEQHLSDEAGLTISEVINVSSSLDKNGNFTWEAPEGKWTILRIGMTPTGTENSPAAPQGKGYEIDKASEELIRFHFTQFMGEIIKRVPEKSLPALKYVIADSYEMGSQNWTDGFEERFEARFGYNPVKYLPVFSGRIVGSADESDRFLWDLRRAVADDIAYEYVGGLSKISNEHNMKLWLENYGHWGFPSEFLTYGGKSDLVSGEFWNEGELGNIECKSASSAAHIYGKPVTSAEAFTASQRDYVRHPALLKKRGDWSYTEGINHFVLHVYIHQPDDDRIPGVNAWFSTEFNRHNTWFDQGKLWTDYLRRCQHMLQKGKYAADVCYFIGEDAPKMTGTRDPELPEGYSYDYINAEVIYERLSVNEGRLTLPDGMSYALMVLPQLNTMRPELLSRIEELVKQGATILGPRPDHSPSLQGYPQSDEMVKQIASRLWTDNYSNGKLVNNYGSGYVLDGMDIQEALNLINVTKDIDFEGEPPVLWTHRTLPGMEIYFITNQSSERIEINPSFRVSGLNPQLWDAVTGEIRVLNDFTVQNDRTNVPLVLEGLQSWFVVFTNEENDRTAKGYAKNFPASETLLTLGGEWTVDFLNKETGPSSPVVLSALKDWTTSDDERIKYYSGTAVYKTTFNLDQVPQDGDLFLNLGDVGVMARARLNGIELGGAWIAPFRIAIGDNLKAGENSIEIEVVNTWRNQIVKDMALPENERYARTLVTDAKPGEALQPSGLKGPVSLERIF